VTEPVVFLVSHHGGLPRPFAAAQARGALRAVAEAEFTGAALDGAAGLVVSMHADQVALAAQAAMLEAFLARGGRIFFNGHVMRPVLRGLAEFVPSGEGHLADLLLTELAPHPVFRGIARSALQRRRGVAGFYGRGHNPPPPGATALTGVGASAAPLDWVWRHPGGGAFFSHAGNDIWTTMEESDVAARVAENIIAWLAGETDR
jgi:hypothetical protein